MAKYTRQEATKLVDVDDVKEEEKVNLLGNEAGPKVRFTVDIRSEKHYLLWGVSDRQESPSVSPLQGSV